MKDSLLEKIEKSEWKQNLVLDNWNFPISIYDLDWNVLNTETPMFFKDENWKIVSVLNHEFDQNPLKYSNLQYCNRTFWWTFDMINHKDHRGQNQILEDIKNTVSNSDFAKSFDPLKKIFLLWARPFVILTARWNSPTNLQRAFYYICENSFTEVEKQEQRNSILKNYSKEIYNNFKITKWENFDPRNLWYKQLLDFYLSFIVSYIPCNDSQTMRSYWLQFLSSSSEKKAEMIPYIIDEYIFFMQNIFETKDFIWEILKDKKLSIWFSDDTINNIVEVHKKMKNIFEKWLKTRNYDLNEDIFKWSVYYTWNSKNYDIVKSKIGWKIKSYEKDSWLKIKIK